MKIEWWMFIPGFMNYMLSDYGRVVSLNYNHTGKIKLRTPGKDQDGYLHIRLWHNGVSKIFKMHRLVWEVFKGPIPKGMQINHLSEDKTDNRLENLSLATPKENSNWGTRNDRISKTIIQYDLKGNIIKDDWRSTLEIQNTLGFYSSGISRCCRGIQDTAYGFIWRYAG